MRERRDGWWLVITMLLAVALFGTVVALYALWLNDRRRMVEESRHDLERRSNEQAREQAADERFARAVELLGHDADQIHMHTSATPADPGSWSVVRAVLRAEQR